MKKALFTFAIVLLTVTAQAQFKVHDDGQISLGSLTKTFGVQVRSDGYTTFRTQYNTNGSWAILSFSNHSYQKHWMVSNLANTSNPGIITFFVLGNGLVFKAGNYTASDSNNQSEPTNIDNAADILNGITGFRYYPVDQDERKEQTKKRIGVSAQEVQEVLPEAVAADDQGILYVDYEALTVILIEAVKEQKQEIELLRKTLEENELLEPEKP